MFSSSSPEEIILFGLFLIFIGYLAMMLHIPINKENLKHMFPRIFLSALILVAIAVYFLLEPTG